MMSGVLTVLAVIVLISGSTMALGIPHYFCSSKQASSSVPQCSLHMETRLNEYCPASRNALNTACGLTGLYGSANQICKDMKLHHQHTCSGLAEFAWVDQDHQNANLGAGLDTGTFPRDGACSAGYLGGEAQASLQACKDSCTGACAFVAYCETGTSGCTSGHNNKCARYSQCPSATSHEGYVTYDASGTAPVSAMELVNDLTTWGWDWDNGCAELWPHKTMPRSKAHGIWMAEPKYYATLCPKAAAQHYEWVAKNIPTDAFKYFDGYTSVNAASIINYNWVVDTEKIVPNICRGIVCKIGPSGSDTISGTYVGTIELNGDSYVPHVSVTCGPKTKTILCEKFPSSFQVNSVTQECSVQRECTGVTSVSVTATWKIGAQLYGSAAHDLNAQWTTPVVNTNIAQYASDVCARNCLKV